MISCAVMGGTACSRKRPSRTWGVPQPARRLAAVDRDARGPHLGDQQALSMAIIATERWVPASVSEANMITPIFWTVSYYRNGPIVSSGPAGRYGRRRHHGGPSPWSAG